MFTKLEEECKAEEDYPHLHNWQQRLKLTIGSDVEGTQRSCGFLLQWLLKAMVEVPMT